MRALALVTARELRAHAPAAAAATLVALLPWLAPLLPGFRHAPASEVRAATAMVLAAMLGMTLALFLGSGLLARDLAEGRMGFFLSLPLGTGTVWAGRLLAAVAVVYGSIALVLLPATGGSLGAPRNPTLLVSEFLQQTDAGRAIAFLAVSALGQGVALLVSLAPLFVLLLASQLATALRSRSAWLLLDAVGLAAAAAIATAGVARLYAAAAPAELLLAVAVLAGASLLVWMVAGALGLARGRVLLARVERAQAAAVSAGLVFAALGVGVFAHWLVRFDAADVERLEIAEAAPAGAWTTGVAVLHHRPSYSPALLFDTARGTVVPLGTATVPVPGFGGASSGPQVTFSRDGSSAVWLRLLAPTASALSEVVWIELGERPRLHPTGILVHPWDVAVELAGDRLALAERDRVTVWSDHGRRLLAAARLPASPEYTAVRLLADGRARVVRLDARERWVEVHSWDLDPATGRLVSRPGPQVPMDGLVRGVLSADGEQLLLSGGWAGRGSVVLLDVPSGRTLAELAPAASRGSFRTAGFLPGGGVAVAEGLREQLTLRLFDRQGRLEREIPLGSGRYAWLGTPWLPERLPFTASVPIRHDGEGEARWRGELREVDLGSGAVRALGGRLAPLAGASPWHPGEDRVAVGSPATRQFLDPAGALVEVDPRGAAAPRRLLPPVP